MHFSMVEVYMVGVAALWSGSRGQSVGTADEDCESDADSVRKENELWGECIGRADGGNTHAHAHATFFNRHAQSFI